MINRNYKIPLIFLCILFFIRVECKSENVTSVDGFNEKCANVSDSDAAFKAIERGVRELKTCISELDDVEKFQIEIEANEPLRKSDTMLNKYFRKRYTAIACLETFEDLLEPCLQLNEIESKRTFVKMIQNIMEFVCYSDQIELIFAEKGPDRIYQSRTDLIKCMNLAFPEYMPLKFIIQPELVNGPKQCDGLESFQACVVKVLENCEEATPTNLVEPTSTNHSTL